jgi:hypothetical protein
MEALYISTKSLPEQEKSPSKWWLCISIKSSSLVVIQDCVINSLIGRKVDGQGGRYIIAKRKKKLPTQNFGLCMELIKLNRDL